MNQVWTNPMVLLNKLSVLFQRPLNQEVIGWDRVNHVQCEPSMTRQRNLIAHKPQQRVQAYNPWPAITSSSYYWNSVEGNVSNVINTLTFRYGNRFSIWGIFGSLCLNLYFDIAFLISFFKQICLHWTFWNKGWIMKNIWQELHAIKKAVSYLTWTF